MKEKMIVSFKEDENGNKYPYVDVGNETHGRPSFRLWVSMKLVNKDKHDRYYLEFPLRAEIFKTQKGSLVLRPSEDKMTFYVYASCGYRGHSEVQVLSEYFDDFDFYSYHSPRGSLGVSHGKLVVAPAKPLKWKWTRSGRLYGGAPQGITITMTDGKEKHIDHLPDGLEALDELKEALK